MTPETRKQLIILSDRQTEREIHTDIYMPLVAMHLLSDISA